MSNKTKGEPDTLLSTATRIEGRLDEAESGYRRVEEMLTGENQDNVKQDQDPPGLIDMLVRIELAADRLASLAVRIEGIVGERES